MPFGIRLLGGLYTDRVDHQAIWYHTSTWDTQRRETDRRRDTFENLGQHIEQLWKGSPQIWFYSARECRNKRRSKALLSSRYGVYWLLVEVLLYVQKIRMHVKTPHSTALKEFFWERDPIAFQQEGTVIRDIRSLCYRPDVVCVGCCWMFSCMSRKHLMHVEFTHTAALKEILKGRIFKAI